MKSLSLLLALMFTINGYAASGLSSELQKLINEYEYSVTVEWDQKDTSFFDQKNLDFSIALDNLFEAGLSSEDISEAFPGSNVPDTLTRETFIAWIEENKNNFHYQGSSWNGSAVIFYGGVAVVFLGFISYSIWYSSNFECESWVATGPRNTCSNWVRK